MSPAHEGQPWPERLAESAEDIAEGARQGCHATIHAQSGGIPAPMVYRVVGNLASGAVRMDQLLGQLVVGLEHAHRDPGHYHDEDGDVQGTFEAARGEMQVAQELLATAAAHLAAARAHLSHLGPGRRS